MRLTPKQKRFVDEFLVDLNATQAAIRAGYSKKTARQAGAENLSKPVIEKAIQSAIEKREVRVAVTQDYVVNKMYEIAEMDVLDIMNDDMTLKPLSQWPKVWRQFLSGFDIAEIGSGDSVVGVLKKIKLPDKVKNLELLGRHLGVFSDRLDITNSDGSLTQARPTKIVLEAGKPDGS